MREAGYTQEDVQDLAAEAWDHPEGGGQQLYAFGHCTNCRSLIIGWSAYRGAFSSESHAPSAESHSER